MNNIKITLSYDGTRYFGWQKTKFGPSIEEELQKAFFKFFQKNILFQAASRTDKNVHAKKQIVNFFIDSQIDPELMKYKLNRLLPNDVRILNMEYADAAFHPTLHCIKKHYKYYICQDSYQLPHKRLYSWHVYQPLNIGNMILASKIFLGKHNFAAFSNREEKDPIRDIYSLDIEKDQNRLIISITGSSFLYKMVRNIVGSLIETGKGKISIETLKNTLNSQNRKKPFITAPAHGLFLHDLIY